MATAKAVNVEHRARVRADAESVFRLLVDLDNWPRVFPPFVHLESLGTDARGRERVGMWSTSGERVEHWVALRTVDAAGLRVGFVPERIEAPMTSMSRDWVVEPDGDAACVVRLEQAFTVSPGHTDALAPLRRTVAELAPAELSAVQTAAELEAAFPELLVVVEDEVVIPGGSAPDVYAFLFDAARWPQRLDHVERATVREENGPAHLLELVTREPRGGTMTTKATRVGLGPHKIAYKHLLLPPLGSSHHVQWRIAETPGGTTVASRQTVVLDESGVAAVLGDGTGLAEARAFVRSELSTQVLRVLDQARDHFDPVESSR
ncbi:aromatase/cyclase [Streptomyces sp. GSL17-111]|uniref:aromatase/cyclase n=1 Tax=Streptomyces sp. GSL17-111 TaxID=3121596 RepID=UPI0030F48F12